ncbi:MAG: hypothetical protein M1815_002173 [Lichina confinis]|nr:MAG: hypothetical protein M1815_002173 [Lichina confinis]
MSSPNIDYYATLEVSTNATAQQIREAYKRQALKHHPDRVGADSPERAARTKRFQQINDAYYTLSDPTRRRDYDATRAYQGFGSGSRPESYQDFFGGGAQQQQQQHQQPQDQQQQQQDTSSSFFSSFPFSAFGFGQQQQQRPQNAAGSAPSNDQFASVFEEMLREQGMAEGPEARPTGKFWSLVGGLSGGAMGFIVANFPGAIAGAMAGNRLGAVRDARGKSVYSVFQELPQGDKAKLLSELAAKVFAHAVTS